MLRRVLDMAKYRLDDRLRVTRTEVKEFSLRKDRKSMRIYLNTVGEAVFGCAEHLAFCGLFN